MRGELRCRTYHSIRRCGALLPGEHPHIRGTRLHPAGLHHSMNLVRAAAAMQPELALAFTFAGLMHRGQVGIHFLAMLAAQTDPTA